MDFLNTINITPETVAIWLAATGIISALTGKIIKWIDVQRQWVKVSLSLGINLVVAGVSFLTVVKTADPRIIILQAALQDFMAGKWHYYVGPIWRRIWGGVVDYFGSFKTFRDQQAVLKSANQLYAEKLATPDVPNVTASVPAPPTITPSMVEDFNP